MRYHVYAVKLTMIKDFPRPSLYVGGGVRKQVLCVLIILGNKVEQSFWTPFGNIHLQCVFSKICTLQQFHF